MKTDDFLAEVIRDGRNAIVDANELQRYIRDRRNTQKEIAEITKLSERLEAKIWALEAKIEFMEFNQPIRVDLVG